MRNLVIFLLDIDHLAHVILQRWISCCYIVIMYIEMSSSWKLVLMQDNSRSFCMLYYTFIVSNHTLNNGGKSSLSFNSSISSFQFPFSAMVFSHCSAASAPFFVIFHLAFPCFCRIISLYMLWCPFLILVLLIPSWLWVFSLHPFSFPPLPFSYCCACHILKCVHV